MFCYSFTYQRFRLKLIFLESWVRGESSSFASYYKFNGVRNRVQTIHLHESQIALVSHWTPELHHRVSCRARKFGKTRIYWKINSQVVLASQALKLTYGSKSQRVSGKINCIYLHNFLFLFVRNMHTSYFICAIYAVYVILYVLKSRE